MESTESSQAVRCMESFVGQQRSERVPVKRIFIQECPQVPSAWGLVLEPIVGEAVCVIRCDAKRIDDVVRAVRTVLVLPNKDANNA